MQLVQRLKSVTGNQGFQRYQQSLDLPGHSLVERVPVFARRSCRHVTGGGAGWRLSPGFPSPNSESAGGTTLAASAVCTRTGMPLSNNLAKKRPCAEDGSAA